MINRKRLISKSLVITVTLASLLTTNVYTQYVQAKTITGTKITLSQDQIAAASVDKMIASLPKLNKITLSDETVVNNANTAFNALTDAQKALVKPSNSANLVAAVKKIADLKPVAIVNSLIEALPKVNKITVNNETAINDAYTAFNALTDAQKALVKPSNSANLVAAVKKLAELKVVAVVNQLIEALPKIDKITLDNETAVNDAYTAYLKLSNSQKVLLSKSNSGKIIAATNQIARLKNSAARALSQINSGSEDFTAFAKAGVTGVVAPNKAAYDSAIAAAKALKGSNLTLAEIQNVINSVNQSVADSSAAKLVINQISALDNTKDTYATDVASAKNAYDALTDSQKLLVTNYQSLVTALQSVADSAAAKLVIDQISALDNTKDTYATDVASAKNAYDALTDAQKLLVTNYQSLVTALQSIG